MLFWSQPLAGGADVVLGAATYEGSLPPAEHPPGLHRRIAGGIGPSQLELLHGPEASWRASQWIAQAAAVVWREYPVELMWVCLPGLDFELQRHGPDSERAAEALRELDRVAGHLADEIVATDGDVIVLSDGGYVPVCRAAFPNLLLRRAGLLEVAQSEEGWNVDFERSAAFALVDHQVAQIYCRDETAAQQAQSALGADPAIAAVLSRDELFSPGLGHDRAGERVALCKPMRGWTIAGGSLPIRPRRSRRPSAGTTPASFLSALFRKGTVPIFADENRDSLRRRCGKPRSG